MRCKLYKKIRTADDILKRPDRSISLVDFIQTRNLNEPPHIVREELVRNDPLGQIVPFTWGSSIDTYPPFDVLHKNRLDTGDKGRRAITHT